MKVCTDACLFGAWAAAKEQQAHAHRVIDIGTGTGLLSLMYAQQHTGATIDAVELEAAAAQQANVNVQASPWREQVRVHHTSIQEFARRAAHAYDVIIANPPFYEADLKSDDLSRNAAHHSTALTLTELISLADTLLKANGSFFVLLPAHRAAGFEQLLAGKFYVREQLLVKQTPQHNYFRSMWCLVRQPAVPSVSEIVIAGAEGSYTNAFTQLLQPYYLNL